MGCPRQSRGAYERGAVCAPPAVVAGFAGLFYYEAAVVQKFPGTYTAFYSEAYVAEKMAGLKQMCADSAEARAQRQAEDSLYNRLGGYDKIHEFTTEVVRLHKQNFRRLVTNADLVEPIGRTARIGKGRPAELFRFRREVLGETLTVGLSRPIMRDVDH